MNNVIKHVHSITGAIHYVISNTFQPHRSNGPSQIFTDGTWWWYRYGDLHRYYGPYNSRGHWSIRGRRIK